MACNPNVAVTLESNGSFTGSMSMSSSSCVTSSSDTDGEPCGPPPLVLGGRPKKMRLTPNEQKDRRRTSISAEAMDPETARQNIPEGTPKTADEIVRLSRACKANFLFRHLKQEQLELVYSAMVRMEIPADHDIIVQGDEGDYFYVVDSGEFDVFVNGQQVVVVEAGGSFGELALMYSSPRAATVTSKVDSVVYALDRVTFNVTLMNAIVSKRKVVKTDAVFGDMPWLDEAGVSLVQLRDVATSDSYAPGDTIFAAGDLNADKFYLLTEGSIDICDPDATVICSLTAPDYFGEKALIGFSSRKFSAVATSDVAVQVVDRISFIRLLMKPCADIFKEHSKIYTTGSAASSSV